MIRQDNCILNDYMDFCRVERDNTSTTIHNNMNVLRLLVKVILEKEYIDKNPFEKLTIPKPKKRGRDDIPDKDEYDRVKIYLDNWVDNYLSDESEFSLINTLIYIQTKTGMRGGEVKLMKWERGEKDKGENHSYSYVYLSKDFKKIIIHFKRN